MSMVPHIPEYFAYDTTTDAYRRGSRPTTKVHRLIVFGIAVLGVWAYAAFRTFPILIDWIS